MIYVFSTAIIVLVLTILMKNHTMQKKETRQALEKQQAAQQRIENNLEEIHAIQREIPIIPRDNAIHMQFQKVKDLYYQHYSIPNEDGRTNLLANRIFRRLDKEFDGENGRNFYETDSPTTEFLVLETELHRYLFLCSIFKNVPMFSTKVDELWHTMILHTREYQAFSNDLLGKDTLLHHAPSLSGTVEPSERALYDFLYSAFFGAVDYTYHLYGHFYKNALPKDTIAALSAQPMPFNKGDISDLFRQDLPTELYEAVRTYLASYFTPLLEHKNDHLRRFAAVRKSIQENGYGTHTNASQYFDQLYAMLDSSLFDNVEVYLPHKSIFVKEATSVTSAKEAPTPNQSKSYFENTHINLASLCGNSVVMTDTSTSEKGTHTHDSTNNTHHDSYNSSTCSSHSTCSSGSSSSCGSGCGSSCGGS